MTESAHYSSITDVSKQLDIPSHILRFWEKQFKEIKPVQGKGGRRYYKQDTVQLIGTIRDLLYNQGYTIRGVKKLLGAKNESDNPISAPIREFNDSQATDLDKALALLVQAKMILGGPNQ